MWQVTGLVPELRPDRGQILCVSESKLVNYTMFLEEGESIEVVIVPSYTVDDFSTFL